MEDHLWALDAEHASLCMAIDVVCDQLEIPWSEESSAPTTRMALITGRVRELEVDAL